MRISVIIPTYKRTHLLRGALNSVLAQTLLPYEIIIGDDTPDNSANAALIAELAATTSIPLRYFHHTPSLKQGGNVEFLINAVQGDALCLLHDDDLLEPTALADLSEPFAAHPTLTASYGKNHLMANSGELLPQNESDRHNSIYYRTSAHAGLQKNALEMAVVQQIPSNSYLIRTSAAQKVGYNHHNRFAQGVDIAFGIYLGLLPSAEFYFVDKYIFRYRLSEESESKASHHSGWSSSFRFILGTPQIPKDSPKIIAWLKSQTPIAIAEAISIGKLDDAWGWYWGPYHRERILSLGGINRLQHLLRAMLKKG